jgi:hypothetical protein
MTDDTITARLARITAELDALKAELDARDDPGDIIDMIMRGELLVTAQVADVIERDTDTATRWCNEAELDGRPLGVLTALGWLVGKSRLLDYIEWKKDRHARNRAAGRAEKHADALAQLPSMKRSKREVG